MSRSLALRRSLPLLTKSLGLNGEAKIIVARESYGTRAAIYAPLATSDRYKSIVTGKDFKLKAVLAPSKMVESKQGAVETLDSFNDASSNPLMLDRTDYIGEIFSSFNEQSREEFLDHLNQDAVSNLKIRDSSERINLYNECIPKRSIDDSNQEAWLRAIRNRSKTIASFPLILKAIKSDNYSGAKLLDNIDNRPSSKPTEVFKEVFKIPHATSGFVRRIANSPDIESAKILHDFLSDGLSKGDKFDHNEFNKRVSHIPLPYNQEEYAAMWKILKALNKCKITNHAKAQIFLNIGNDWLKNARVIKDGFEDLAHKYSRTIADDLILPAYIKEFKEKSSQRFWGSGPDRFKKFDDWFTDYARLQCASVIEDAVLSKLTPERLFKYADRLDHMTGEINEAKPDLTTRLKSFKDSGETSLPEWHKTFPDQEINGVKFKVLTNSSELQKESDEVHNCVVSLRQKCLLGESHVLSGVSSTGERFSVRFDSSGKGAVRLFEASGPYNKFISEDVRKTVDILCKKLSNGEIKVNQKVGNVRKDFTVNNALGFDIEKEDDAEGVFKAYRKAGVFPGEVEGFMSDRDNFYNKIGLQDFFARNIAKDIEKSVKEDVPSSIQHARAEALRSYGPTELVYLD